MVQIVADVRGWHVERDIENTLENNLEVAMEHGKDWGVVRRLVFNWRRFVNGKHPPSEFGKNRKQRKPSREYEEIDSDDSSATLTRDV